MLGLTFEKVVVYPCNSDGFGSILEVLFSKNNFVVISTVLVNIYELC